MCLKAEIRECSRNEGCGQLAETLPEKRTEEKRNKEKENEKEEPVVVMGTFFRSQEEPRRG